MATSPFKLSSWVAPKELIGSLYCSVIAASFYSDEWSLESKAVDEDKFNGVHMKDVVSHDLISVYNHLNIVWDDDVCSLIWSDWTHLYCGLNPIISPE